MKNFKDYYLGFDMGTDSIGWAVSDEEYNLLKFNGKSMWGTHLFDSGKTAEERRMFRTSRRRTQRSRQRIELLQELFSEEICKVDYNFFQRLEDSKYFIEDKAIHQKYTLFNDDTYSDSDYHKEFPTIYHLRSALIHNDKKYDIRLLYLAISHIIKHRGHFLFEGNSLGNATSFDVVFDEFLNNLYDYDIEINCSDKNLVQELLLNKNMSSRDKTKALSKLFNSNLNKQATTIAKALSGATFKLSELFDDESLNDAEITSVCFKKSIDDDMAKIASVLDDRMFLFEKLKAIYDWSILAELLKGSNYLADAKIKVYNKHYNDLSLLKTVIKKYAPAKYNEVFKDNSQKHNYCTYVGKPSGKTGSLEEKVCSQEDFCKYVEKILSGFEASTDKEKYLVLELSNRTLLPKQVSKENSVIPYQLNLTELEKILDFSCKHYDFLNRIEDGISIKDKILKIFTFRIPYYVGPLNEHSNFSWIVRKEQGKIHPWNFEQKVDIEGCAIGFIERMTNFCTYLVGEKVLPRDSILYSKFVIYNQLNNIKVDGEKLSIELKNQLFKDKFLNVDKAKKLTSKGIVKYLETTGAINKGEKVEITGIDNEVVGSMKAKIDFERILKNRVVDETIIEDIISQIVIFADSKELLASYIKKQYKDVFTDDEIKAIKSLRYSGWGKLSHKFLLEIANVDKATGEYTGNIIEGLENTQCNLEQLLSNDFNYNSSIENFNKDKNTVQNAFDYSVVDDLYVSPAVKRSIWRTLLIAKEISKITNKAPKKIFIEMARDVTGSNKGKRTISRKNHLLECYKSVKKDFPLLVETLENTEENKLRRDKLYLYYTQMGKCMYSGDSITLSELDIGYDIDHIYPQSKTKDDSMDNRVLVKRKLNEDKTDIYPLPSELRTEKTVCLWKNLLSLNLISKEKFNRLMRSQGFSAEELAGFISRQIVETRQSTKAVAELLKKAYPESDVVYVKSGNVSKFRQEYDIVKCRSVNDYHHAKDAYLNIVVGNVYDVKFTKSPAKFIKDGNKYSLNKVFDYNVSRGGNIAWIADNGKSISGVKKVVSKNNILFTRFACEQKGGFFDQMPVKHGKGQMPLKTSDDRLHNIDKYGGYNKISGAYFALVRHTVKGKAVKSIEAIPLYLSNNIDKMPEKELEYFKSVLENPEIIIPKIKINSLFEVDGFRMHLSGRSGSRLLFKVAHQLVLSDEQYKYFKKIESYINKNKEAKAVLEISPIQKITKEENLKNYDAFTSKLKNTIYSKRLSAQIKTFESGREVFEGISLEEQCKLLSEAVKLFECNSMAADLTLINGAGKSGILVLNNKVDNNSNIKIINQSITGLFENKVDISKL